MRFKFNIAFFVCLLSTFVVNAQSPVRFDKVSVVMGDRQLILEYAKTGTQRARGLMFRESLCDDCGMLFAFDNARIGSIWMKNTQIPLDLAYVNDQGIIVDIFQLKPFDLTPIRSSQPVTIAIEMNQGWFANNNLAVGDSIKVTFSE